MKTDYGYDTSTCHDGERYVSARVMCSDGIVRTARFGAGIADTYFSVPCRVSAKGKTVSGYMCVSTAQGFDTATADDPAVAKFRAYTYGANAHVLPSGEWKVTQ